MRYRPYIVVFFLGFLSIGVFAQPTEDPISKDTTAIQNPLSAINLPLQNNTNFGIGAYNRTRNALNIQPVIPIKIGKAKLINRLIIPLIYSPDLNSPEGGAFGLGDITYTALITLPSTKSITVGIGATIIFPTRTDPLLGVGQWFAGPAAVFLYAKNRLIAGFLISNYWSLEGTGMSYLYGQYFLNYNFKHFYIQSAPIFRVLWTGEPGNRATLPIGLGIGKVFNTKTPINFNLGYYYSIIHPDGVGAHTVRVQANLVVQ